MDQALLGALQAAVLVMTARLERPLWWAAVVSYIALIYSTLGIAPSLWYRINSFLGGKGLLAQYVLYCLIGVSVLLHMIVKRQASPWKFTLFFLFTASFFVMVKFMKNPAEKIHMAEYGLLGVLVYNALKVDFDRFDWRLYILGAVICVVAGALDEVIQWILPNRYFTVSDLAVNGLSGVIALLVIRFNILKRRV